MKEEIIESQYIAILGYDNSMLDCGTVPIFHKVPQIVYASDSLSANMQFELMSLEFVDVLPFVKNDKLYG